MKNIKMALRKIKEVVLTPIPTKVVHVTKVKEVTVKIIPNK